VATAAEDRLNFPALFGGGPQSVLGRIRPLAGQPWLPDFTVFIADNCCHQLFHFMAHFALIAVSGQNGFSAPSP
jgi:hypothetical protein